MIIPTQSFPNRSHSVQCWAIIKIIKPGFISVGDEWLNASFQLHQGQDSRAFYQYTFITCKWIQWMGNIITRWRCHWCSLWAPVTACTAISRVRVRVQIMQRADPASIAQVTKSVIPADHCCDLSTQQSTAPWVRDAEFGPKLIIHKYHSKSSERPSTGGFISLTLISQE